MKRVKLALNYRGLDVNGILVFAVRVKQAMSGNVHFPDATYFINHLEAAGHDLSLAIHAPVPDTLVIKTRRVRVEKILYAIKAIVEMECKDDELIALSSGFDLKAPGTYKTRIFSVKQGANSGTVDLSHPSSAQRTAYLWEIAEDPINLHEWRTCGYSVLASFHVSGLVAGNKYWFRACSIASDGVMVYSNPLMLHVI